ncbi:transglycosylase domain-containing protein [Tepidibacter formicigenes]|jgi:penicillin-binding protein 1A|uniref:Penicillin-binding protein 1A n=1 Tax=Tepidibacter formicigenes DSM 15518 TaxID=1123349 RepID=A0A1M6NPZ6_9FIRM|nr:transglycosylase domain-containing protein [Tepidibacter formicigenes]SHJ97686.1 penicillin-binding protein 1A [Tepidibacter formicigenes DSM 15518]
MRSEKDKNKSKESKNKKKISIFRVAILTFIILFIVGTACGMGIIFGVIKNAPPIDPNNIENMLDESSFIYDKDGNLIEKVHGTNFRSLVTLDKIPSNLQNAVIAIEDERFYEHNGVDIKRIFGALWYDIKTMSKAQGASTITQQLAKNMYTSSEKTITRKIKDAYYALEIEKHLSKDEILQTYLNTFYLGRGAVGVQAAAQTYFSKDVSELTLAESAMIAGITKNPSKYSPYTTARLDGSENLDEIKNLLVFYPKTANTNPANDIEKDMFKKLLSKGLIDNYQYDQLLKEQIVVRKAVLNPNSKERQEVILKKMLELGYITESEYEKAKNESIVIKVGKKKASNVSSYFVDLVKDEVIDALVKKGFSEDEARDMLYNGGLRIYSTMDISIQKILEKEYQNSSNFPGTFKDNNGNIQPQSAMVIMDYHNGEVKALVGGRMIGGSKLFNRAINPRQPGSAIKPLAVYLPALDNGMTAATPIDDTQENFRFSYTNNWKPKNYANRYRGPITLRESVQHSSNVGSVKTAEMLSTSQYSSVDIMIDYLENMGITTIVKTPGHNDKNFAALTLGGMTKGITPLEMTAAYGAIANKGTYIKPIFFTKVEDASGKVLLQSQQVKHKIVSPQTAYVMTDILTTVVTSGTGGRARLSNMPVAGKTGTTSNKYDAWFAGYTPYYVGATWIGNDMNKSLSSGSRMSAMLWKKVMSQVHSNLPRKSFERPSGIIQKTVCTESGDLATHFCEKTRTEIFVKGTEPTKYCEIHTQKEEEEINEDTTPSDIIDKWLFDKKDSDENNNSKDNQSDSDNNEDNKNNQNVEDKIFENKKDKIKGKIKNENDENTEIIESN